MRDLTRAGVLSELCRYRIGLIDDFRNEFSFVDYRDFGGLQVWNACRIGMAHRGHQLSDDSIHVFLNFKKVGIYQDRQAANTVLSRLLSAAPVDLAEFRSYLVG